MLFILVFVLILIIFTYYVPGTGQVTEAIKNRDLVIAHELRIQHAAAARTCTTPAACPLGLVDATGQLPTPYANAPATSDFRNGRLVSFSTGTHIVTYYQAPGASVTIANQTYGYVLQAMVEKVNASDPIFYGPYDSATGIIQGRGAITMSFGTSSYTLPAQSLTVPPGTAGVTIPNGAPVIATRI